jgi:hypothetical protein
MSRQGRIGLVVATLVVLVVAFVVLSPGGDDESDNANTTAVAPPPAQAPTGTATTQAPPPPAPTFETIQVKAGQPVGGIKTITVNKGDQARIQVSSPDTTDEIHLHGYDLKRDLKAGGRVRFSFDAKDDGIYEIELEGSGTQIGKLVVEP